MAFSKFTILNHNEGHQRDEMVKILINTDHIVSLKPIRISTDERKVIEGYWLRLSNGRNTRPFKSHRSCSENLMRSCRRLVLCLKTLLKSKYNKEQK